MALRDLTMRGARLVVVAAILALTVLAAAPVVAGVNPKNGNFYVTYTDIIVGAAEIEVTRTYNSRSSAVLSYGHGWGTPYDTRLRVNGDGSVSIEENGSGLIRTYLPDAASGAELDELLDLMMEAMERAGWIASDQIREDRRRQLAGDSDLRRSIFGQLVSADLLAVPPPDIAVGVRLTSVSHSDAVVTREAGGYYRRTGSKFERFDLEGRIMEIRERNQAGLRLLRTPDGHLRAIIGDDGSRIDVRTNADGRIIGLSSGGREASYTYDDRNRLLRSVDTAGNVFVYEYDDTSNMTAIRYADGSSLELAYDAGDVLVSQKQRNGEFRTYEYGDLPTGKPGIVERYFTVIRSFDSPADTRPYSEERIEYAIGADARGSQYTAEIRTVRNGHEEETHFHRCGAPTLKRSGNQQTVFDYDDECRMTYKRSDDEEIQIEYDRRSGKIARVVNSDLFRNISETSEFTYDLRGQLVSARNDRGESVTLDYDSRNRITRMTDATGEVMSFDYNDMGKPVHIAIEGVGALDVTYDAAGEITEVKSDQGHEMALRVTQAFQRLLALVKPSGVNFNL